MKSATSDSDPTNGREPLQAAPARRGGRWKLVKTAERDHPKQLEGLKSPEAELLAPGQRTGHVIEHIVIVNDRLVANVPTPVGRPVHMVVLATGVAAL